MKQTKHTPGPWEAVEVGQGGPADAPMPIYEIHAGGGRAIVAEYVDERNAHLIVAAPDLYDALQELLSVNADPAPGWSADLLMDKAAFRQFLDGCDARKKAAEDKARAAIVKAKHGG